MRMRLTGSRRNTSASAMLMRLWSATKSSESSTTRCGRGLKRAISRSSTGAGFASRSSSARAEDRGQVADILRDQEVVLHEALDVAHAGMRRVAEPHRDLALDVEREPLLGAPHDEMHVAAHRPEEILGAAEHLVFLDWSKTPRSISSSALCTR